MLPWQPLLPTNKHCDVFFNVKDYQCTKFEQDGMMITRLATYIDGYPFIVRISYSANFIMIFCKSCLYHLCLLSGSIKIVMLQMFVLVYSD